MLANSKILLLFFLTSVFNCAERVNKSMPVSKNENQENSIQETELEITPGAYQSDLYWDLIRDKKVALLVNQTSMIGQKHLVDSLQSLGVEIVKIFAPEHGFRGKADAGETVKDGIDTKSGISIQSLYGKKKKPSKEDLQGIDMVVFDIQDVGARFYTYISGMTYVMEACAENAVDFLVLDRPNPNGHYVDGPVLKDKISFVGLHPVPVVHGMTIGEYAEMVNGERWLKDGLQCRLKVIKCSNYNHKSFYELPVKPSPNLPNMRSVYLYPSICFFEGTTVSEGRGTNKQFQVYGHPKFEGGNYQFTPKSMPGAKYPKLENQLCNGFDLSNLSVEKIREERKINLNYLIEFYNNFPKKETFFLENNFFDLLAGSDNLRKQILAGKTEKEIRETWQEDLKKFKQIRKKYLLYEDYD